MKVKPGLSGIGSIVFRKEDELLRCQERVLDFYDQLIAPYKGKVEAW